jgi:hypothetical protein
MVGLNPKPESKENLMSRTVTLFTGQWADLPIAELAPLVKQMGYDGVELACWGDHFDVQTALNDEAYIPALWKLLTKNGLTCVSISSHLVGQCVCDLIDERHQAILDPRIWGDGGPEGDYDYPTVDDGIEGMAFIETAVASAHSDQKWTPILQPKT